MSKTPQAPRGKAEEANERESEGGLTKPVSSSALPDGITAMTITQYRVGSYTYTSLDDALAQHKRLNKNG